MASTSGLSIQSRFKYDVFLSFRGDDTRRTFVDHLYDALRRQGIYTYKDDERIEQGKRIWDELIGSIKDSKFFIIVFSKTYASSSWCLDELAQIMECQKTTEQIAYPVFYDVEPTEVRNLSGAVGDAFIVHKKKQGAEKWRNALKDAADLAGWELKKTADGHEAKFINEIVGKISLKLHSTQLRIDDEFVGMEPRIKLVLSSLDTASGGVSMIGIRGIGGGGKTSLAKALFHQLSFQFKLKSFVEGVSEASPSRLKLLQKQILSDVLHDPNITVNSVFEGISMMKNRLRSLKVLVVLDNVDHTNQLEALAGACDWFKPGSIILITTRDMQVLVAHRVNVIHDVNLLEDEEAMFLFSKYAFGMSTPPHGYEMLSREVVRYAASLPLTIKSLGLQLHKKDKRVWEVFLKRLEEIPPEDTQKILELSYINLEEDHKEIFLDIACLMKGWKKDDAIRALESCGFYAEFGLGVLVDKSLITISNDEYLGMHDSIQEMARNIVRRPHYNKPATHSRLWIHKEIEDVLGKGLVAETICAISVDGCLVEPSSKFFTEGFGKYENLRFLCVVSEVKDDYRHWDQMANQVSQIFPNALRYLKWSRYPFRCLPKQFQANNLVALDMSCSKIIQFWEGGERKVLNSLRFLNLRHSQLTILDLGLTPKLEWLDLEDCYHLVKIHTINGYPEGLVYLNLSGCVKIESFVCIKRLESLEVLCLNRLYLKQFPDIIPEHCNSCLEKLHFRYNDIEHLPSSIANLQKLVYLDLHSCNKFRSLPESICGLQSLKNLELYDCVLEELPEGIDRLECLEKLNVSFARIRHLPDSICKLKNLKYLNLSSCLDLEKLPDDLGDLELLEDLILEECEQIRDVPDSICKLKHLRNFSLLDCVQLEILPEELGDLQCLKVLNLKGTRIKYLPSSMYLLSGLEIREPDSLHPHSGVLSTSKTSKASSSSRKKKFDHI